MTQQQRNQNNQLGQIQSDLKVGDKIPLAQIEALEISVKDRFLGDLTKIDLLIQNLPILVPRQGRYKIEVKGKTITIVSDSSREIEVIANNPGTRIKSNATGLEIFFYIDQEEIKVVLTSDRSEQTSEYNSYSTSRTTSPWRADSYRERNSTPSESHGGGSGER